MVNLKFFISVIIPAYNSQDFIARAIQSVLDQNYQPLEIIVVDDGSTDETAQVVKSFSANIHYHRQKNSGPSAARNTGLRLAHGEIVCFIDADDIWAKDKLKLQLSLLHNNPDKEIIMGFIQPFSSHSNDDAPPTPFQKQKGRFGLLLGNSLIRKSVFEKVGLFDESMLMAEDTDWFFRTRELGIRVLIHENIVMYYRHHNNNLTRDKCKVRHYTLMAFKKSIDRRKHDRSRQSPMLPKFGNPDDVKQFWH